MTREAAMAEERHQKRKWKISGVSKSEEASAKWSGEGNGGGGESIGIGESGMLIFNRGEIGNAENVKVIGIIISNRKQREINEIIIAGEEAWRRKSESVIMSARKSA